MNVCLLIKTNSVYSYLWPIIEDYIKDIKIYKVLAYNEVPPNKNLPKNFDKYIKYDQKKNFARRLLQIIPEINMDYIVFVPDIDIIINLNVITLTNYVKMMEESNIDRIHLSVFDGFEKIYKNKYSLCNLNSGMKQRPNHYIPYDAGPAIWNKNKFLALLNKYPNETYDSLEQNPLVQNYCKSNLRCFGIQLTLYSKVKYHYGRTYSSDLDFLHITVKGKFLKPISCYHNYEGDLKKIIKNYNLDVENIGFSPAHHANLHFKKLIEIPSLNKMPQFIFNNKNLNN